MKKGICFSILLATMFLLPAYRIAPYNIEKIYAELEMRQLKDGKSITFKGEICYEGNGNMTSHYYYPRNYILLSNKAGEIKLYDPGANTVVLSQNNQFSSQTSQFYTFLSGKQADMGVNELGYVQEKVSMENGLVVSIWKLKKADKKRPVQKIKLVHQNGNPIYMHYEKADGGIVRKVFYYGFTPLEHISFPATSTEIAYGDKDSMITKTSFRNFKINQEAVSSYFNYKIPGNAKIQRF